MKFIIDREQLLEPLQQIVNVIEKRQTMPILANVLLKIESGKLVLTGTDLEIQIIAAVQIEIIEEGSITVPARKLFDIFRNLPEQAKIRVELVEDKIKIHSGRSRFSLSTLAADDYPEFSEGTMDCQFFINSGQFKKSLDKTIFCMANQDVRYYLNGLMLNISNNILKLVASDGHRLSIYEDEINQATGVESKIILPRKGVIELSRLLDDSDTEISASFSSNNIKILYKNLIFSAKLIDAKYPEFGKVFMQEFNNQIRIQKQVLKDALTRVSILANEKFKGVNLNINSDSLKLTTHNPEHEEAEEELVIDYDGEPISISFNAQYLLEAVSNLDSEMAVITIASNGSSCFIEEPEQRLFKFIVMPMRI